MIGAGPYVSFFIMAPKKLKLIMLMGNLNRKKIKTSL